MLLLFLALLQAVPVTALAKHFSRGTADATRFGVHEIELQARAVPARPFAVDAAVQFTPPSGRTVTVSAFYDGGATWRARVYVAETGRWRWQAAGPGSVFPGGSGEFQAVASSLPGMLRIHAKNPRQWMTDNGRWFLNLSDTAYFLFEESERDWQRYLREDVEHGITSVRAWALPGKSPESSAHWDSYCAAPDCARLRLENFRTTDQRLEWMLEEYPALYVQFILFPRGAEWRRDEQFWANLMAPARTSLMRYMLARFGAYPQLFWLIANDTHYGPEFPNNSALASQVGEYFSQHDLWGHLISTGPARSEPFPFRNAPWVTYYHIEDAYQLSATIIETYRSDRVHVFLGEDRYEQDRATRDPRNPAYYYRCLFWSWFLAGGSANYGGRWSVVQPYTFTPSRPYTTTYGGADRKTYTTGLHGLDSVVHIKRFFEARGIDLSAFRADDSLVLQAAGSGDLPIPKLARRGADEFLVYLPNARAGGMDAGPDPATAARIRLDLRGIAGAFQQEWYRAEDGTTRRGELVEADAVREFVAPWQGGDAVLHLRRALSNRPRRGFDQMLRDSVAIVIEAFRVAV